MGRGELVMFGGEKEVREPGSQKWSLLESLSGERSAQPPSAPYSPDGHQDETVRPVETSCGEDTTTGLDSCVWKFGSIPNCHPWAVTNCDLCSNCRRSEDRTC